MTVTEMKYFKNLYSEHSAEDKSYFNRSEILGKISANIL